MGEALFKNCHIGEGTFLFDHCITLPERNFPVEKFRIVKAWVKNLNKMGQPLYLNSINPLLMWFLSSVKIKKYFQTIQHFAFESKMIFNLFPYCSCHSHGLPLSQYALLGITIKTNMSEFKHLSTGQCLNTSRHGVRAEGVHPLKGKKQFLKDSSL